MEKILVHGVSVCAGVCERVMIEKKVGSCWQKRDKFKNKFLKYM